MNDSREVGRSRPAPLAAVDVAGLGIAELGPEEVLAALGERVGTDLIGYERVVRLLYIALLGRGHVLLEGAPGIAKTMFVRTFATALRLSFKRIQFTPDMLPSDIIGTVVLNPASQEFEFRPGPVFAQVLLADEINRAPPKVQSALLEAMQEHQVTSDGVAYPLPQPFIVIATQNPVEQEGTYPLPEAELDRLLFRLLLDYPSEGQERAIVRRHERPSAPPPSTPVADAARLAAHQRAVDAVFLSDDLVGYITALVRATREEPRVVLGASPRCGVQLARAAKAQALLSGRTSVYPEDVQEVAFEVLNHRLTLRPSLVTEAYGRGVGPAALLHEILTELLERVPVPR